MLEELPARRPRGIACDRRLSGFFFGFVSGILVLDVLSLLLAVVDLAAFFALTLPLNSPALRFSFLINAWLTGADSLPLVARTYEGTQ